jgi:hypothetical protein
MLARNDHPERADVASGVNVLAGLWLLLSPWIFQVRVGDAGTWNSIVVGIVVALFAATRFVAGIRAGGLSAINTALGAWTVISPFVYRYSGNPTRTWNSIVVGIIVLFCAAAAAWRGEPRVAASEDVSERDRSRGDRFDDSLLYGAYLGLGWPGSQRGGTYRGIGPKGYQRSDDQIHEDICARMMHEAHLDARDITVRVAGGQVDLEGTVDSDGARRLAEHIADSVPGVRDIDNELRVRSARPDAPPRAA